MKDITATGLLKARPALLAFICGAATLTAGESALANHSIDINFNTDTYDFSPSSSNSYAYGHVESGPTPCVRNRSFKLYRGPVPRILVDTARSSANGFFALGGDLAGTNEVLIRMASKKFGPQGRRHKCESDTNTFYLGPR